MENKQVSVEQTEVKGVRISLLHGIIIVVSCAMSLLLTMTAYHVHHTLRDTYTTIDDFVTCSMKEEMFMDGSDYLTNMVRLYTVTGDPEYMDNYIEEAYDTCTREKVVDALAQYDLDEHIQPYLESALKHSNDLIERELYAIRLAAEARGRSVTSLPQVVGEVSLSEDDLRLDPTEMAEKARDMAFGATYQTAKMEIVSDMQYSLSYLHEATQQRMADGYSSFQRSMRLHRVLIGIQFAATLAGFLFTILWVVLPMTRFVRSIRAGKSLKVSGAYECRCLAKTCNAMFARSAAQEDRLRRQAEHDALTGIYNRGAFDALRQKFHDEGGPVGLLIIDVDKFKLVNDGYGHEMGDRILKQVAELLTEKFRANDYPARIGGDEFSVILPGAGQEQEKHLAARIETINDLLAHPTGDLPAVSLSVGGAFSPDGFTDQLYKHADLALYQVKEHGRCGCRFYTEEMGSPTS